MSLPDLPAANHQAEVPAMQVTPEVRAAFLAYLDQQPEWKVREALESGEIPAWHQRDARAWLEQKSREFAQRR
jgi:hypothetical protein